MQLSVQGKLLRVIEERKMRRVGGLREIAIDVRFIAATNRDLESDSARGLFRADLFFRLNGVTLSVPPLRERVAEIEPLAREFIGEVAGRLGRRTPPALSDEVLRLFLAYGWPGNVRELRNVVERAVVLCGEGPIEAGHVPEAKMRVSLAPRRPELSPAVRPGPHIGPERAPAMQSRELSPQPADPGPPVPTSPSPPLRRDAAQARGRGRLLSDELSRQIQREESARILDALGRCAGNQTQAALLLGISRRTLVQRLTALGLPRPRKR
jgi:DNA-binding NtrC family response regulator